MVESGAENEPGPSAVEDSGNDTTCLDDKMGVLKSLITLTQAIHSVYDSRKDLPKNVAPGGSNKGANGNGQQHKAPSILPPPEFDDQVGHGLTMSRAEYVSRQNQVFRDLTGFKSPKDAVAASESEDPYLSQMMELYIMSLDKKVYKEMALQNQLNEITVDASADVLAQIMDISNDEERNAKILSMLSDLRSEFTGLQFRTNAMVYQRCQLESQRIFLKQQYAAELSKRVRLDHTVRLMSKKLVDLNERAEKAEAAQKDAERALKELHIKVESLELAASLNSNDPDDKVLAELSKETSDMASLDAKLRLLYREIGKLQKLESIKEIPDTPEKVLARILVFVDNARGRKGQHVKDLIKAFIDLFEARERQLSEALSRSQLENQIYLARCDRLTTKTEEQADDMRDLLDRTVDLVLADKQLREGLTLNLDGIELRDVVLKRCLSFIQNMQKVSPDLFTDQRTAFLQELEHFIHNSSCLSEFEQSYQAAETTDILSRLGIFDKLKGVDIKDITLQIPGQEAIPLGEVLAFKAAESRATTES